LHGGHSVTSSLARDAARQFPHARENCATKKWTSGLFFANTEFCANCFCFVCDSPASECKEWEAHAQATHTASMWRDMRAAANAAKAAVAAASVTAGAAGGGRPVPPPRWSCDKLLKVSAPPQCESASCLPSCLTPPLLFSPSFPPAHPPTRPSCRPPALPAARPP
jgi:hypothetical protein